MTVTEDHWKYKLRKYFKKQTQNDRSRQVHSCMSKMLQPKIVALKFQQDESHNT